MKIVFRNSCKSSVKICIDEKDFFTINSNETKVLNLTSKETLDVSIFPNTESSIKNNLFHIVLKVSYSFSNLNKVSEFIITREKIRFASNAFYERLFIDSQNTRCISELILPLDPENLKKIYSRLCKLRLLLYGPFEDFFGLPLFLILIGIALMLVIGWKVAVVYFVISYLLLVLINYIIQFFWKGIFKKHCKFDEKKDLDDYLNPKYISEYYAMVNRTPFLGKKDID